MSLTITPVKGTTWVRRATYRDVPAIVALAMRFLEQEPAYQGVLHPNGDLIAGIVNTFVNDDDKIVYLSEYDGIITGLIALLVGNHIFTGERTATELMWFVDKAARGRDGMRLLYAAEQWARSHGARQLEMVAPSTRTGELYERLGFRPMERLYVRNL